MSGGFFNYENYKLDDWVEQIKNIIEKNNKPIPYDKLEEYQKREWSLENNDKGCTENNYNNNPYYYYNYSDETIENMKVGYTFITIASIYLHRIDWLESGDDGEESFNERLKNDLEQTDIQLNKLYEQWTTTK